MEDVQGLKEPQNCWEFWNCPIKEKCIVFLNNMGQECWFVQDIKQWCPRTIKYEGCFNCPWYKKLNNTTNY